MQPSVTQILSPWSDFSMVPERVLEAAADRGSSVHRHCAAIAQGLPVIGCPQEQTGYLDSFRRWFHNVREVLMVEKELVHPIGFCGHPDLIVRLNTGELAVIDIKTPQVQARTWPVQLAAYAELAFHADIMVSKEGVLQLHPEGLIPVVHWYDRKHNDNWRVFLAAFTAWQYFKGGKA